MKKIYLSLIATMLASITFAQSIDNDQEVDHKKIRNLYRRTAEVNCDYFRQDSSIFYVDDLEYFRTYSFYDNYGNESYELKKSSISDIDPVDSTVYQYDSKSRVIEEITFEYDSDLEDYLYSSKTSYSYDDENSTTTEESFEWTEDGKWLPTEKIKFSTNTNNVQKTIEISMDFDLETNKYTHIQTFGEIFNPKTAIDFG